jgi:hypothetical protein
VNVFLVPPNELPAVSFGEAFGDPSLTVMEYGVVSRHEKATVLKKTWNVLEEVLNLVIGKVMKYTEQKNAVETKMQVGDLAYIRNFERT